LKFRGVSREFRDSPEPPQNEAFADGGSVAQLSLLLRYRTSNQRAYTRCLADLFKLRTERRKDEAAHFSEPKISRNEAARLSEPKTSINGFESQKASEAANQPPKPRKPYYFRNPKYAHMLLTEVPEAERFIKLDPNGPEPQTETPITPINGFESQIDPRAEKLIRELREIRLRLDQEDSTAA
jgi:hypothetical protein